MYNVHIEKGEGLSISLYKLYKFENKEWGGEV